jgi:hypothetical protein
MRPFPLQSCMGISEMSEQFVANPGIIDKGNPAFERLSMTF